MSAYLFVHFKEKRTPDGEQVYFGISKDGFHWDTVNDGMPVLWSYEGDRGVRDFTIIRTKEGKFIIMATDLCLAYGLPYKYENSWENIARFGSRDLVLWESEDLIHWSNQRMAHVGREDMGCVWAPDIIYDKKEEDYVIHWSSSVSEDDYQDKRIFYCRTKDFKTFTAAKELYRLEKGSVIDSAMYEKDGMYYLFMKEDYGETGIFLVKGSSPTGPFERIAAFDEKMKPLKQDIGKYEAPTAFQTDDGTWCLFLDYYAVPEAEQGYVPFIAEKIESGLFERSDASFAFPYGFKHGTVLKITEEEYDRLKGYKKSSSER